MGRPLSIKIEVEPKSGDFTYHPALLHADRDDSVSWQCKNGEFTVSFPERTPFKSVSISSKEKETAPQQFRKEAEPGVYHYHVAVAVQAADLTGIKVFVDSGCPGVEIP